MKIIDFQKILCPFVRKENEKGHYVVTPEITEGYEWVFEDDTVIAVEKLHGTNVSVIVEEGHITSVWNRSARVPFFNRGKSWIIKGVMESYDRGYCDLPDGQFFGELVGPKVNGNPYKLDNHLWIPFETYGQKHLAYTSWGKYPKTFEAISEWFKTLMPLFSNRIHGRDLENQFVEGIVFTHPDGRYAKLRRDMFEWHIGKRHKGGKR